MKSFKQFQKEKNINELSVAPNAMNMNLNPDQNQAEPEVYVRDRLLSIKSPLKRPITWFLDALESTPMSVQQQTDFLEELNRAVLYSMGKASKGLSTARQRGVFTGVLRNQG